eukprot:9447301-Alexandrium_andersonii.AAC.1
MDPRAVVMPSHDAWAGSSRPIAVARHDWYECVCRRATARECLWTPRLWPSSSLIEGVTAPRIETC